MTEETVDTDRPRVIAHRGFAGVAPENTVGAARFAADAGADVIEVDVRPTSDGEVVVFHDDGLSERDDSHGDGGLTDRSGLVHETPWADVRDAEVLGSGETVPTLAQVLDAVPPSVGVNVELKDPGSDDLRFGEKLSGAELAAARDRWHEFVVSVIEITDEYDNDLLFSSFYEGALAVVREIDASIPLATLFGPDVEAGLAIAREYDCEAVHPPLDAIHDCPRETDAGRSGQSRNLVRVAHEAGREVNVYTVRTWHEARLLADRGVDGIIADYPGLLAFDGD
ncbi:glycerophosphodiester phosphodiesterase [Salinirubrum litoreum]|uniref:Glycerophosphodiester phosphodiesterase n=1 Tax=Salinirubrum litoreum TaxID=1126234 RepID=A0ABD5R862_9EURY|nr:glycerophosphodiester phosphodiesterase family protein [Salinirubrum litoreum]